MIGKPIYIYKAKAYRGENEDKVAAAALLSFKIVGFVICEEALIMRDDDQKRDAFEITVEALQTVKNQTVHQAGKIARKHHFLRIPLLCVLFVFLFVYNVFLYAFIRLKMRKKIAMALSMVLTVSLILSQIGVTVNVLASDGNEAEETVVTSTSDGSNAAAEETNDDSQTGNFEDIGAAVETIVISGDEIIGNIENVDGTGEETDGESGTETVPGESSDSKTPGEDADDAATEADSDTNPGENEEGTTENTAKDNGESGDIIDENSENEGDLEEGNLEEDLEESEEESEEPEELEEYPEFKQSQTVDGVCVTVHADEGVLPAGAHINVSNVSPSEQEKIGDALDDVREDGKNVALRYNFDISILDKDGKEIEPDTDAGKVKVTFILEEASNTNLEAEVYHIKEDGNNLVAEELNGNVNEERGEIVAETDGFSFYTVEFTYNELTYVMEGDSEVTLSTILAAIGIEINGAVGQITFSNSELLGASYVSGEWVIAALKPFSTTEWMKVDIDGVVYEVVLTDSQSPAGDSFILGKFDDATGTFKEAQGSGTTKYKTILIMFTDELVNNESVTLPNVSGFTLNSTCSTNYTKIISMSGGKTSSEIASYVRNVKFNNCKKSGQNIKVTLSGNEINYQTVFYEGTGHYYQFIPISTATPWTTAYNKAMNMNFLGEQGYLATVTSVEEDKFLLSSVKDATGWLGGTNLKYTGEGTQYFYSYDGLNSDANQGYWYWACGPEKGQRILDCVSVKNMSNQSSYYAEQAKKYYFNWNTGEPNWDDSKGNCLTILNLSGGSGYHTKTTYCWNDVINARSYSSTDVYSPKGYFVEYGGLDGTGGSSAGNNDMAETGGIYADLPSYLTNAGLTKSDVIYNPRVSPARITISKDTTLTQTIVLPNNSNIELDLGGHTLSGAPGKPVISTENNAKVQIEIVSGTVKSVTPDENGADGVTVIDLSKTSSGTQITIGEDTKIARVIASDGNNNEIPGETGGEGGIGIKTNDNVTVTIDEKSNVNGGNGGNGTSAGKGGDAVGDGTGTTPGGSGSGSGSGSGTGGSGTGGSGTGGSGTGGTNGSSGKEHVHNFVYVKSEGREDQIAVYCDSAELKCIHYAADAQDAKTNGKFVTLTINTPDSVYNGLVYNGVTFPDSNAYSSFTGDSALSSCVIFYIDSSLSTKTNADNSGASTEGGAPSLAGDYYASISKNGVTVKDAFSISKTLPEYTTPVDAEPIENGTDCNLINYSSPKGTFYFRLGEDGEWSTSIPTATTADSYVIYYYVKGDRNHVDAGSESTPAGSITSVMKNGVEFIANADVANGISMPSLQKLEKGVAPEIPSAPSVDNDSSVKVAEFLGWYSEPECINEFDFTNIPERSIKVYASWKYKTFKVGDKYYNDISDAASEAQSENKPIELLNDAIIDENVTIPAPGIILNDHVLTVEENVEVTIRGNISGPGTVAGSGETILEDATVKGDVVNEGNMTVKGTVTVVGDENDPDNSGKIINKNSLLIDENGHLDVEEGGSIQVDKKGKITNNGEIVNDGRIDNKGKISGNKPTGDGKIILPPAPSNPGNSGSELLEEAPLLIIPVIPNEILKPQETDEDNTPLPEDNKQTDDTQKGDKEKQGNEGQKTDNKDKDKEDKSSVGSYEMNELNAIILEDETVHAVVNMASAQTVLETILSDEERKLNTEGTQVVIRTEFSSEFETKKEEKKVAKSVRKNMPQGMQAVAIYDFNLYKQVGNFEEQKVDAQNVRVSFDIPAEWVSDADSNAGFAVMRVYKDDKGKMHTEVIDAERDGNVLMFDADTDSNYVIISDSQTALSASFGNETLASINQNANNTAGNGNNGTGNGNDGCKAHWFIPMISLVYLAVLYLVRNKNKGLKLGLFGLGTVAAIVTVIVGDCKWDIIFAAGSVILSLGALNVIKSSEGRVVFEMKNEKAKKAAYVVAGVGAFIIIAAILGAILGAI